MTIGLLGAAVLVAVSAPVAAFFAHLDRADVSAMTPTLVLMAPGLVGFGLIAHISRALYALEEGRAAARATVSGWLVVVVAMVLLGWRLSGSTVAVGLGAASSIGMTVAGVALLMALHRTAGREALEGVPRAAVVAGLVALVAAAVGWGLGHVLSGVWHGALGAVGAGVLAALGCLAVAVGGMLLLDRGGLRALLSVRRGGGADSDSPPTDEGVQP